MVENFYRAFEERYYAPRKIIKKLREQYLPFVERLVSIYPSGNTFDIGCGRGEWLELMQEFDLNPYGVDLDEGMLSECRKLNLPAEKGDAVDYLFSLPSSSQIVVTAFHVVEHISFEKLHSLVKESLRILKPGGLLIMESPNPENIAVSTCNFYLDPTHLRPIPSKLLAFLPEYYGFNRVKILRLQESKNIVQSKSITLHNVIYGVSPDYAVIAQKSAPYDVLQKFDSIFQVQYGLSLDELLERYDQQHRINKGSSNPVWLKFKKTLWWLNAPLRYGKYIFNRIYQAQQDHK